MLPLQICPYNATPEQMQQLDAAILEQLPPGSRTESIVNLNDRVPYAVLQSPRGNFASLSDNEQPAGYIQPTVYTFQPGRRFMDIRSGSPYQKANEESTLHRVMTPVTLVSSPICYQVGAPPQTELYGYQLGVPPSRERANLTPRGTNANLTPPPLRERLTQISYPLAPVTPRAAGPMPSSTELLDLHEG